MRLPVLRDLYHFLLEASWPWLLAVLTGAYLAGNALFACAYLLGGDGIAGARPGSFADAFFFSVQTMATIGYGGMAPRSLYANVLVTVEALFGLLGVAMVTGIVFAKFARPTSRVLFSRVAVVAPRDGVPSLMFRMANERSNNIVEAQVHVVLVRNETTAEGEPVRRFHELPLLRARSPIFALSWTAVHSLTDGSPLLGATPPTLAAANAEVVVSLIGFDETFAQTVHARHVYYARDIVWHARFVDVLVVDLQGRRRVDYERFHELVRIEPAHEG